MKKHMHHVTMAMGLTAIVLALASCGPPLMIGAAPVTTPPADYALVSFIRPTMYGGAVDFDIWDSGRFIGKIRGANMVQYQAAPGDHIFIARSENTSAVKANLAAGKHYIILVNVFMGVMKARVAFDPVNKGDGNVDQGKVDHWFGHLTIKAPNPEVAPMYEAKHGSNIEGIAAKVAAGEGQAEIMMAGDTWP